MALKEHAACNSNGWFDDSLSSYFHNVDARFDPPINLPVGDGTHPIFTLKARAVLVDMEEGVVNQLLRGNLSELFNSTQLITDISGSGNNWAHGHNFYGPKYSDTIIEKVRREGFFLLHSLGGGTGSGLGSYILELLHDAYPKVFRFSASLFPSTDDDVITSPYNSRFERNYYKSNTLSAFTLPHIKHGTFYTLKIHWNTGGFKVGVCRQPASGIPLSLVCLANNTCIRNRLLAMKHSFNMLFRKRVYIHHYTEYMDFGMFDVCSGIMDTLIEDYGTFESMQHQKVRHLKLMCDLAKR
ncbi:hypothetical protein SELMODRAFT_431557 [Selaginella moellendorffii]|uniref:Tubulin/FtsZ GTPase domain-containing protein n=1 Tax=Selaginella moellendorffii TaxID=88036 RepID=D8TD18_SELML|nr:hypothetical protein SELMODRAFT_431557 [Selaginella moellendorffii]